MKSHVRTLQIAFTYIGTIVGAGFATGQEILRFLRGTAIGPCLRLCSRRSCSYGSAPR